MSRCSIPGCRGEVVIVYLGCGVCGEHWNELMDESQSPGALAGALGIQVAQATATEEVMGESDKTEKKAAKKTKGAKAAKAKKERVPKEDQPKRVFAIRVTDAELDAIHAAAGPRNATRFIRAVAAAFASEDEAAFREALQEAKKLRA